MFAFCGFLNRVSLIRPLRGSGGWSPASNRGDRGSASVQSMRTWRWTKHHWNRFIFGVMWYALFSIIAQWPRCLKSGSAAARLPLLRVRIPQGYDVCCEFCVLSGRGLCEAPIPRPEMPCRVCLCVCLRY